MENRPELYWLLETAKLTHQAPSEIIGIRPPILAYQFNRAVAIFGVWLDNELSKTNKRGKPINSLRSLIYGKSRREIIPINVAQFAMAWGRAAKAQ